MIVSQTWLVCEDCKEQKAPYELSGNSIRRKLEPVGWSHIHHTDRCPECTVKHREKMAKLVRKKGEKSPA